MLLDLGLRQVRVRHHGNLPRIETDENGIQMLMDRERREQIHAVFKGFGFTYVLLDLLGYRTGSMNETLALDERVCSPAIVERLSDPAQA